MATFYNRAGILGEVQLPHLMTTGPFRCLILTFWHSLSLFYCFFKIENRIPLTNSFGIYYLFEL